MGSVGDGCRLGGWVVWYKKKGGRLVEKAVIFCPTTYLCFSSFLAWMTIYLPSYTRKFTLFSSFFYPCLTLAICCLQFSWTLQDGEKNALSWMERQQVSPRMFYINFLSSNVLSSTNFPPWELTNSPILSLRPFPKRMRSGFILFTSNISCWIKIVGVF